MINIYYTKITEHSYTLFDELLEQVPLTIMEKVLRYHQKEDRMRTLLGMLLLKKALTEKYGFENNVLEIVRRDEFNRPYINNDIDFNISHSGNYVVCAVSEQSKIGIDIEEIVHIATTDYDSIISEEERFFLASHSSPVAAFYSIWTKKEAVLKAIGRGLMDDLNLVILKDGIAVYNSDQWNMQALMIDKAYTCHIAFKGNSKIELQKMDFPFSHFHC